MATKAPTVDELVALLDEYHNLKQRYPSIPVMTVMKSLDKFAFVVAHILDCHNEKVPNFRTKIDDANKLIQDLIEIDPVSEDHHSRDYCRYCNGRTDLTKSSPLYRHFIHENECAYMRARTYIQNVIITENAAAS